MASKISLEDVEHVSLLCRLRLTDAEKKLFTSQLNSILEFAAKLNELDTEGVDPTFYALSQGNVLRKDLRRDSLDRDKVLANAPESKEGAFKVPKVFE